MREATRSSCPSTAAPTRRVTAARAAAARTHAPVARRSRVRARVAAPLPQASARNFQLLERGRTEGDRIVLLYGKLEDNSHAMDFQPPLSILNAFALCLSVHGW